MPAPSVTVVILTYNGERYLGAILASLARQDYAGEVETLVIDSGSTDGTLDIVAAHPAVRLHGIPNSEFGHGRTRNLGAQLATGEIVAYLTHDAVPLAGWLTALVEPFVADPLVVAVMGKQVPRANCFPLLKYEIRGVFAGLGPDFGTTVFWKNSAVTDAATRDAAGFYSDVNSAARRSLLTGDVPYRDVSYAEDQLFGRDVIDLGLRKAYAPGAAVEHSNDLTLAESGRRIREEVAGLREIGTAIPPMSVGTVIRASVAGAIKDSVRIVRDADFSFGAKLKWLVVNPWFHVVKWTNYRRETLTS
jgi:rhamnosyltransferase